MLESSHAPIICLGPDSATLQSHEPALRPQVTIAFDETTTIGDVDALLAVLNGGSAPDFTAESLASSVRAHTPSCWCFGKWLPECNVHCKLANRMA